MHTRGYSVDRHDRRTKFSATLGAAAVVKEESIDAAVATTRRTRRPVSVEESGDGGGATGCETE